MRNQQKIIVSLILVGILLIEIFAYASHSHTAPSMASDSSLALSIQNNQLMQGGKPWLPQGMQFNGFITPYPRKGIAEVGFTHFGVPILEAVKRWNVNVVEFMTGEEGLDPQDPQYDAHDDETGGDFLTELKNAVALAEQQDLSVIIRVQKTELKTGDKAQAPTDATERALVTLAKLFGNDPDVAIDDYNLPHNNDSNDGPTDWNQWLNGGSRESKNPLGIVGVQELLNAFRGAGGKNLFIAEASEQSFAGMWPTYAPKDPLNDLAYGVSPGAANDDADTWQQNFGFLVDAGEPVMVANTAGLHTGYSPNQNDSALCKSASGNPMQVAEGLFNYLAEKHVGMVVDAFDDPYPGSQSTIVTDWSGTPSTFYPTNWYTCGTGGGGAGALIQKQYGISDTNPPSPPGDLTATPSGQSVSLSWKPSTDTGGYRSYIAAYEIFRDGTLATTTLATTTNPDLSRYVLNNHYSDPDVSAGIHTYDVVAEDSSGNLSATTTVKVAVP